MRRYHNQYDYDRQEKQIEIYLLEKVMQSQDLRCKVWEY